MSLKDHLVTDLATFFDTDDFAESVTYDGGTITALIERLQDPAFGADTATRANLTLKASDVPGIAFGDTLTFDSAPWIVEGILQSDKQIILVSCRRKEAHRW